MAILYIQRSRVVTSLDIFGSERSMVRQRTLWLSERKGVGGNALQKEDILDVHDRNHRKCILAFE